jgi:rhodanese-related sulfurtransferase
MTVAAVDLRTAWQLLQDDPKAVLLDVRTEAEWNGVGVPDLDALGKQVHLVEWQLPTGEINPRFVPWAIGALDPTQNTLVLCRSGARSQAAAEALEDAGFVCTHNVIPGFEGPVGPDGGRDAGWKGTGLPWTHPPTRTP